MKQFSGHIGLDRLVAGRFSFLLVLNLFMSAKTRGLNPAFVIEEIRALEGLTSSRFKPPIQNKYPPLKGLWHKHYRENGISSLARNVRKGMNIHGLPIFEEMIQAAKEAGEDRYLTPEDIPRITDDVISGNLARLADSSAMTGEWLLFAEFEGKKYYLGLCTHETDFHESVRRNIDNICCHEFPFLSRVLKGE